MASASCKLGALSIPLAWLSAVALVSLVTAAQRVQRRQIAVDGALLEMEA